MTDVFFRTDIAVFNYRTAGIWIHNGHVLLHKNVKDSYWALPGGRVKLMEESAAGLRREFQEELRVDVTVDRLVWITENFFQYDEKDYHEIGFYYQVTSKNTETFGTEEFYGIEEGGQLVYKWVPVAEMDKFPLRPEFLREGIKEIPSHPEHITVKQPSAP